MNKPYTIVVDARFFAEAGPGRYIKNILEHLEKIDVVNNYCVFVSPKGDKEYNPTAANFKKRVTTARWYSWSEQTLFLSQIMLKNPDLLYVPHFNIPILYPKKLVTAIPDIIMHTFSTELGTTLPKSYFRFKKYIYKIVLKLALLRSSKVIVPTYDVYNDIVNNYPNVNKAKFVVAYEGVDPVFSKPCVNDQLVLKSFGLLPSDYLLYISSMYEHKNVDRLIDAFVVLKDRYGYTGKLVLIGKYDKFSQRIYDKVFAKGLSRHVLLPGTSRYVFDSELVCLRKNAQIYVFPSLKEGFSLTPLEAQVAGLPCVISNISCHKEVFDDSVVYFDPYNVNDMAEKINLVLNDSTLQQSLKNKGYECAAKYDWLNTAKSTLQVFNGALTK